MLSGSLFALCIIELVIGSYVIIYYLKKYKSLTREYDGLTKKQENLQEHWDLERARMEAEIDARRSELSSLSLHYIQKHEQMNSLRESIESIQESLPKTIASKFEGITDSISALEPVDKEWENFRMYFNDVNYGFYDRLRTTFPNLSLRDLKLCALLRMNLETKQIATIMGVSPESAKVTRHRIRKKLGLKGGDNLYEFLNKITALN